MSQISGQQSHTSRPHLDWQYLEEIVLGQDLVDGPEPHVRGVGVPARRQEVGVGVPDPGDRPVAHPAHPAVEEGRLAQDGRDVPRLGGVEHRVRLVVVVDLVLQPGPAPSPTVTVVDLIQLGRLSAQQ